MYTRNSTKIEQIELLVHATSPMHQTSLISGASRKDQKRGPCDYNFEETYDYTLRDWSPRPVPATSPLVCSDPLNNRAEHPHQKLQRAHLYLILVKNKKNTLNTQRKFHTRKLFFILIRKDKSGFF